MRDGELEFMKQYLYELSCIMPFLVCLLWSVILGLGLKEGRRSKRMLWYFSLACTLLYFCHSLNFSSLVDGFPAWSQCLYYTCNLAVYPLFYIYINSLTTAESRRRFLPLVLAPALLIGLVSLLLEINGKYLTSISGIIAILFAIEVILTGVFGFRNLILYRRKIANFYADTDERALPSLTGLLILLLVTAAISSAANLVGRDFFNGKLLLALPSFLFSALLFSIFHWGYKCLYSADDLTDAFRAEAPEETLPQPEQIQHQERLYASICTAMEQQRLFLKPDFKITDLVRTVGSNRTYISNCINRGSGKSFSDFVHSYRIRHAISLMEKGEQSLCDIAVQSGYLDGNAFYKAFSRIMGKSPSAWIREHCK